MTIIQEDSVVYMLQRLCERQQRNKINNASDVNFEHSAHIIVPHILNVKRYI